MKKKTQEEMTQEEINLCLDSMIKKLKFHREKFEKANKEYANDLKEFAEFLGIDVMALTLGLVDLDSLKKKG